MATNKRYKRFLEKFLHTIDYPSGNTNKLFSVGLIGTTGVGKSTIAELLSKELNLYVASNDKVRRFLNKEGLPGKFPEQKLLQYIAEESSRYLYKNKISHVIDADLVKFHGVAKKNAENYGVKFFLIHLICPENVIFERLRERKKEIRRELKKNPDSEFADQGHSLSYKKEYLERTKQHNMFPLPDYVYFTIDTSQNVDVQINKLKKKLKKESVL